MKRIKKDFETMLPEVDKQVSVQGFCHLEEGILGDVADSRGSHLGGEDSHRIQPVVLVDPATIS